jgi:hypothetical protein
LFLLHTDLLQRSSSIPTKVPDIASELIFSLGSNMPNWEVLKTHLYREGRVTKEHCHKILRDTMAIFSKYQDYLTDSL